MKQTRLLSLTLGAAALAIYGCGGGGSSSGSGNSLANGRAAINNLASGAQTTTTQSLTDALTLFQSAVKADPTDPTARFGEAVALAGLCTDILDGTTTTVTPTNGGPAPGTGGGVVPPGGPLSKSAHAATKDAPGTFVGPNIPAPPPNGILPPAPPTITGMPQPVPPNNTLGLFWFLDRGLSNPYTLLSTLGPVTDLHLGLMPFSGYGSDTSDVTRREKMLTDLGTVLSDLAVVEADSSFTYTLPSPDQNGQTVTVGLPEVYLFDAYINSLQAQIALSLAYVRDPGNYSPAPVAISAGSGGTTGSGDMPPAPPVFTSPTAIAVPLNLSYSSLDTNNDGKLEPNEYLPPSPFLTLRSATFLQTAQTAIAASAAKETLGIQGVLARPVGGNFLVPNTPAVATILNNISTNVVPLVAQAAIGPVTLTFPHYQILDLVGAVSEGGDSAGGVFQYIPAAAVTADTPPAPPVVGGKGGSTGGGAGVGGGTGVPTMPPGITVTEEKVTIDLTAWFKTPPQDLKSFAPTYTLTPDGGINSSATVYPDSTFGGLFPQGLPVDLLL